MKKILLLVGLLTGTAFCAANPTAGTQWNWQTTATAQDSNGCSFDSSTASAGTDYSTNDNAALSDTSLACVSTACTVTSGITAAMVGNGVHIISTGTNAAFTTGWYTITAQAGNGTGLTLNVAPGNGLGGVFKIGGACSGSSTSSTQDLAALKSFTTSATKNTKHWFKSGTYTWGASISGLTAGNDQAQILASGYTNTRGDDPYGVNAKTRIFSMGANTVTTGSKWTWTGIRFSGTANYFITVTGNSTLQYCIINNLSSSGGQIAIEPSTDGVVRFCEITSPRGTGIYMDAGDGDIYSNYIHMVTTGIQLAGATGTYYIIGNVISDFVTNGVLFPASITGDANVVWNTLVGGGTARGTCINAGSGPRFLWARNNIINGCATGINGGVANALLISDFNDFYNNTTPRTYANIGRSDQTLNPNFNNVTELNVTGGITASFKYIKTGAGFVPSDTNFAFYMVSGTGTTNSVLYPITAVSANGDTLTSSLDPGANATTNHVIRILRAKDFTPGRLIQSQPIPGGVDNGNNFPKCGAIAKPVSGWLHP